MEITQNAGSQWSYEGTAVGNNMSLLWTIPPANPTPNPVPTITSISPSTVPMNSPDTWVTLTGTGFVPSSQVLLYPLIRAVDVYVSSTELQALIPASHMTPEYLGVAALEINVQNPAPGGGWAQGVAIPVVPPTATITSISPTSVAAGSPSFTLTVNGSNFHPQSEVTWNTYGLVTTFISPNQLTASVGYNLITNSGTASITVNNGGDVGSNAVAFNITSSTSSSALGAPKSPTSPGSPNPPQPTAAKAPPLPGHFPGWKVAKQLGNDFLAQFLRSRAGLASSSSAAGYGGTPRARVPPPSTAAGFRIPPNTPRRFHSHRCRDR